MAHTERKATTPPDILILSEARIPTVRLLEQILSRVAPELGGTLRSIPIADFSARDITPGTVPLFARVDTDVNHGLAMMMHRLGIAYWYYLDDNFLELDPDTDLGRYYHHPVVRVRLESLLRHADRILAATPALADYLRGLGYPVSVAESFFDFSLVPSLIEPPDSRPFVRGGFASSADRGRDLIPVIQEVLGALQAHPDLEFELISLDYDGIPSHPRLHRFPILPSYEEYVRFQLERAWDFAIAPLSGARSNIYKTDNKFREYAAFGIPGIYQDAPPYAAVDDERTGLIVGRGRTWRQAIDLYLARPDLRRTVRLEARADVQERRSIEAVSASWKKVFADAPRMGADASRLRRAMAIQPMRSWAHARLRDLHLSR